VSKRKKIVIGIMPNVSKKGMLDVVIKIISNLKKYDFDYLISNSILDLLSAKEGIIDSSQIVENKILYKSSDMILSLGGDGTMLHTAYESRFYHPPLIGVNFGKLGFLAEFDINKIEQYLSDLKNGRYIIEERITLEAFCNGENEKKLFALNDIVIDKGRWPKMIDLKIFIDNEYVSTFSADGVIVATPTGSTGYSLSAGGPIINPHAEAITICPLSPHTLTMRPLVISDKQLIRVEVNSLYKSVQINCDGQRVYDFKPPLNLNIKKCEEPIRLVHSKSFEYFDTLRSKLYWGLDIRNT
jgi:NAD+ kinase